MSAICVLVKRLSDSICHLCAFAKKIAFAVSVICVSWSGSRQNTSFTVFAICPSPTVYAIFWAVYAIDSVCHFMGLGQHITFTVSPVWVSWQKDNIYSVCHLSFSIKRQYSQYLLWTFLGQIEYLQCVCRLSFLAKKKLQCLPFEFPGKQYLQCLWFMVLVTVCAIWVSWQKDTTDKYLPYDKQTALTMSAIWVSWQKDAIYKFCHLSFLVKWLYLQCLPFEFHDKRTVYTMSPNRVFLARRLFTMSAIWVLWQKDSIYNVSHLSFLAKRLHLQCLPFEFLDKKTVCTMSPIWISWQRDSIYNVCHLSFMKKENVSHLRLLVKRQYLQCVPFTCLFGHQAARCFCIKGAMSLLLFLWLNLVK